MRKSLFAVTIVLFISAISTALLWSCDKDTNSYLKVQVIDEKSRNPVDGVDITISQQGGTVSGSGVTNASGVYEQTFVSPAIIDISARKTVPYGERRGSTSVRLIEGEVKEATITLPDSVYFQ
ncbi:MAG: carboxypeptidase regulatory-like domain-containing protein [Bacteroidales bacterium]|nr:carboxypeptidase regulatory-like domain-containing protein [Bacteroidales bacterium]